MRPFVLASLLVAGCSFEHGALEQGGDDARPIDAPDGDAPDGDPSCTSYSTIFDTCAQMTGSDDVTLTPGTWTYSTDTHVLTGPIGIAVSSAVIDAAAGPIDVVFVASFTVQAGATLRVVGPVNDRAFGIAATGAVEIDGIVDLSANGAGARDDIKCGGLVGKKGDNGNGGGGGGGGGAFQGAGGSGSQGDADGPQPNNGGAGGMAIPMRPGSPIGGCDGGPGGDAAITNGGEGGDGGGAIYIASATSITVDNQGVIDAGGEGGSEGGSNGDAGGGGGSGGMVLLESKGVMITGTLAANGGGGGEGNTNGVPGQNGQRGKQRALGGKDGDDNGGDGGDGGADSNLDGVATTDLRNGGGGGGGGGAGFIAIGCPDPSTNAGTISPPFAAWP